MPQLRKAGVIAGAFLLLQCISACIIKPNVCTTPDCRHAGNYLPRTSPSYVIRNMATSFQSRDFNSYTAQLCPEYVFRFIPDISGRSDSLIRNEEANFAEHLFATGSTDGTQLAASKISLAIDTLASNPDSRVGHEGWLRYYVNTRLAISLPDGQEINVVSPAYLFFHQDNSGLWCLAEWQDETPTQRPERLFSIWEGSQIQSSGSPYARSQQPWFTPGYSV